MFGVTVAVAVVAVAACCGKKTETTEAPEAAAAPTDTAAPTETPEPISPDWKTKCPQADRPLGGTVTARIELTVHKEPAEGSEHIGGFGPGTWVNLLGQKQNWLCVDYPCAVGKLCPGWVEATYTQRKTPVDAGVVVDAAVPEAAAPIPDAGGDAKKLADVKTADAAAPPATTTTPPGKAPPGKRPPVAKPPK